MNNVYIIGAKQISAQSPLSEDWMDNPLFYKTPVVHAIDPDYKQYFAPNEARRLGKILKRAMLTSQQLIKETGISNPEAIITGTGLGCIENTEAFLNALILEGEQMLKPTHFMQSTHNTISSLISIDLHSHAYNSTYTHKGISFDCVLLDAFMQLKNKQIQTALVGAHDETVHSYSTPSEQSDCSDHSNGFKGEASVGMMLSTVQKEGALCRLNGIEIQYRPSNDELHKTISRLLDQGGCSFEEIDAVMIGLNGHEANDQIYTEGCSELFPKTPLLHYKHLFGESHSASGLGVYAAATCLHQQRLPAHLFVNPNENKKTGVKHILFYNQTENKNHSFILLSSCGE